MWKKNLLAIIALVSASLVCAEVGISAAKAENMKNLESLTGLDFMAMSEDIMVPSPGIVKVEPKFGKIVGGVEADKGEFPFIVSLRSSWYGHYCAGSLIAKNWVLTAAHCVDGITPDSVMIGLYDQNDVSGAEGIKPIKIIKHPKWDSANLNYDYALIQLAENSSYPLISLNKDEIEGKVMMTTAGWGTTSEGGSLSKILLKVDVPFVNQTKCSQAYPNQITENMICAGFDEGGKDSCQGDSGGPLVIGRGSNMVLAGVLSWGEGCARPGKPGVYSNVSKALNWIGETVK